MRGPQLVLGRPNKLSLFLFQKLPPSPFVWIKNEAEVADNGPPARQQQISRCLIDCDP